MDISSFSENIRKIINEKEFINTEFKFGFLNKDSNILNSNIKSNIYNRFYEFISSKYDESLKSQKIYYHNDMKLVSINENTHICVRSLPSEYNDFYVKNNFGIRMIIQNNRIINNINFPSLIKYDNIELNEIKFFTIKYKNSEIILEFIVNNNVSSISLKTKIDKYNINNFILNFQFIIGKFYLKKFKLDVNINTYNSLDSSRNISRNNSRSNSRRNSKKNFQKKKLVQNKHFKSKVNRNHYNTSNQ